MEKIKDPVAVAAKLDILDVIRIMIGADESDDIEQKATEFRAQFERIRSDE